jgi:hypothetical protein
MTIIAVYTAFLLENMKFKSKKENKPLDFRITHNVNPFVVVTQHT